MPRALITGISGFVGSHLAEYLIENTDWEIDGMIRWRSPLDNLQAIIPLVNQGKRVRLLYADLRDTLSVQKVVLESSPDYVFHLAAQSFPRTSFDAPLDTLDTNTQGTLRLLDAIRTHPGNRVRDAWVHVCSSSEVYGKVAKERIPITEDCPFHPASPYAISKVGADLIAQHYAEAYGMNIMVTRMFTHTGPRRGDVFAESSFAKQIAMLEAGQLEGPVMVGNLDSMRTIADVRDAVDAYHTLLTVNPKRGAVYNIGGSHSCTVREILQKLGSMAEGGAHLRYREDPIRMRPIDADNQIPDCTKFKEATRWEPRIAFSQTMSDLLDYWRGRVKSTLPLQR